MKKFLLILVLSSLTICAADKSLPVRAADKSEGTYAQSTVQFDYASGFLSRGFCVEAEAEFNAFLKLYPSDSRIPLAIFRRGEARFALTKYAEAGKDYYTVLTRRKVLGKAEVARLRYGLCLFNLKRFTDSFSTLKPLCDDKIKDAKIRQTAAYYCGRSLQNTGKPVDAAKYFEAVSSGELAPLALFAKAELLSGLRKHSDSAAAFGQFSKKFSKHQMANSARLRQAEEFRQDGKLELADKVYSEMKSSSPKLAGRVNVGKAWVLYLRGKHVEAIAEARKALRSSNKDVAMQASYVSGLSHYKAKDFKKSLAFFEKVVSGSYASAALRQSAWAAYHAKLNQKAIVAVEKFRKAYPHTSHEDLVYVSGKTYMRMKNYDAAVKRMLSVRNISKLYSAEAAYDLSVCYERLGDMKKASSAYGFYVKKHAKGEQILDAILGQGRCLLALKEYEAALSVYARLLAKKSTPPSLREYALNRQAVCYYYLKQYANMHKLYTQLLKEFPGGKSVPESMYWLAWYAASKKQYPQAIELYSSLMLKFPKNNLAGRALYWRAMAYYQSGKNDLAAKDMLVQLAGDGNVKLKIEEMFWLGSHLLKISKDINAEKVYVAILKRKPSREMFALASYCLAESRRKLERWSEALAVYDPLVSSKDKGIANASGYGAAVCLRMLGDVDRARKYIGKISVSSEDPLSARILFELGLLDMAEQKYASAAAMLMKVGLLYDDEKMAGEALLKAGQACLKQGDIRKARMCFLELSGAHEDSYGKRYPKSSFTAQGVKELATLDAAAKKSGK